MTANALEAKSFATARQRVKIAQLCIALGIKEHLEENVTTAEEASHLITQLCDWLRMYRASSPFRLRVGMSQS